MIQKLKYAKPEINRNSRIPESGPVESSQRIYRSLIWSAFIPASFSVFPLKSAPGLWILYILAFLFLISVYTVIRKALRTIDLNGERLHFARSLLRYTSRHEKQVAVAMILLLLSGLIWAITWKG